MKLKCLPDDFQVEEQIAPLPRPGPFALYRLTKTSLGTLEAIAALARKWDLPPGAVAFAGLKDRHALTRQFVTIRGGPQRGLKQQNLELAYIGQVGRALHAKDIRANRFTIVLRDLAVEEAAGAAAALDSLARNGLPNYFDSQRFGSVGKSGEFIARPWCLGDYERALWLAIADENVHDCPEDTREKQVLRQSWGDWARCRDQLDGTLRGEIAAFLAERPGDYKRALTLIPQELRSIYLAAFQSDLWNRTLAALLQTVCSSEQLSSERIGPRQLPFFQTYSEEQRQRLQGIELPLPSARLHVDDGPIKSLLEGVLAEEGMELRQVRIKYPRDTFFSKGDRSTLVFPQGVTGSECVDELHRRRRKLTLGFAMPRGSYATILVKRLGGTAVSQPNVAAEDDN